VLTPLILGPALKLPGCKRLHLSIGPSWVVKSAGRATIQIVSTSEPPRLTSSPPTPLL